MASENFVTYQIMLALREQGWLILQYHPPGGQARWAIQLEGQEIYPDIVALKANTIAIMENKRTYHNSDVQKLRMVLASEDARAQIRGLALQACRRYLIPLPQNIVIVGAHGFAGHLRPRCPDINLVHVSSEGYIAVIPAVDNPLQI